MKSQSQPNFYFSAYPLKVIKEQESEKKSYLHIYTNPKSKKKYAEGLKILPMFNPYSKKDEARLLQLLQFVLLFTGLLELMDAGAMTSIMGCCLAVLPL